MTSMIDRRSLIHTGLCLIASPAIVRFSSLMPVRASIETALFDESIVVRMYEYLGMIPRVDKYRGTYLPEQWAELWHPHRR